MPRRRIAPTIRATTRATTGRGGIRMSTSVGATLELLGGTAFRGTADGRSLVVDAEAADGDCGARPLDLLLFALGGSIGTDVLASLRRAGQDVGCYTVRVRATRRDADPRAIAAIVVEHCIRGRNIDPEAVRRAVELSTDRHCSVAATLTAGTRIDDYYVVHDDATGEPFAGTHRHIPIV